MKNQQCGVVKEKDRVSKTAWSSDSGEEKMEGIAFVNCFSCSGWLLLELFWLRGDVEMLCQRREWTAQ